MMSLSPVISKGNTKLSLINYYTFGYKIIFVNS